MTVFVPFAVLCGCAIACAWRTVFAPSLADRLLAAAMAGAMLTFVLALAGVLSGSSLYLDAALPAALLSFSGTIILAKFVADRRVL